MLERGFIPKGWMLTSLVVGVLISPAFVLGANETVIELTVLGWSLVFATAALAFFASIIWLVATSRSGSVDSTMVELRRARPSAWLGQVGVLAVGLSAAVGLLSWTWMLIGIRNLAGENIVERGVVVRIIRTGGENLLCQHLFDVQLKGMQERICVERGLVFRTTPDALQAAKVGDSVNVVTRKTLLGVAASVVPLMDN